MQSQKNSHPKTTFNLPIRSRIVGLDPLSSITQLLWLEKKRPNLPTQYICSRELTNQCSTLESCITMISCVSGLVEACILYAMCRDPNRRSWTMYLTGFEHLCAEPYPIHTMGVRRHFCNWGPCWMVKPISKVLKHLDQTPNLLSPSHTHTHDFPFLNCVCICKVNLQNDTLTNRC